MGVLRAVAANSLGRTLGTGAADLLTTPINVALVKSEFQTSVEWPLWAATTAYVEDDIVRPAVDTGHAYVCTVAGTSGGSEPSFPASGGGGGTVVDGTVTWHDLGLMPPLNEFANRGFITGATAWAASTGVTAGDFVYPTTQNGHVYEATNSAVTGGSEPTWPLDRTTVVDGGVTWQDIGMNPGGAESTGTNYPAGGAVAANPDYSLSLNMAQILNLDDVVFANATVTARWAVAYFSGTIGSFINPYVGFLLLNDDPADVGSVAADFAVRWSPVGALRKRAPRP